MFSRTRFTKTGFLLFFSSYVCSVPTRHQESLKSLLRQMPKFNPWLEERETVCCLQSKVTNHMSTDED